jgi:hypothetical protein
VLRLWVCVRLLVTALAALAELGLGAPLPARTLPLTAVMVPVMV